MEKVFGYFQKPIMFLMFLLLKLRIILLEAYPKQLNLVNIAYKGAQKKNMTFLCVVKK